MNGLAAARNEDNQILAGLLPGRSYKPRRRNRAPSTITMVPPLSARGLASYRRIQGATEDTEITEQGGAS